MIIRAPKNTEPLAHPVAIMEKLVLANDWRTHNHESDEISVEISGHWAEYFVTLKWQPTQPAIQIIALLDIFVIEQQRAEAMALICRLNERLWLGHFCLSRQDSCIIFRHTMPMRGTGGATPEQITDLLETTVAECEKHYAALLQTSMGCISAENAAESVLLEPAGHA